MNKVLAEHHLSVAQTVGSGRTEETTLPRLGRETPFNNTRNSRGIYLLTTMIADKQSCSSLQFPPFFLSLQTGGDRLRNNKIKVENR